MTNLVEYSDVVQGTEPAFDFKAISGQIGIDKAQGVVEAFVSGVGNKDSVGDVVVSGAFNGSLKRRKPRVVWGHDWNQPIGKVLEIYEVPKSDPRLPVKMKQAGIGGLFAKVQFNLNTERGREAFANVAFYGMEQEWSIGYKTITADFDAPRQANMLKEVELYEISPVLHGANQLTGTISVKDDNQVTFGKAVRDAEDEQGTWATPDIALAWSKTFGCSGYHSHGGGFLPCGTHEEYLEALKKFDGNANINSHNNYLSGVEVDEAKDASCGCISEKNACACVTAEKGYMVMPQSKPEYLKDPMALLLMAYNEMLKIRGAGGVREATLNLIKDVEEFLTAAPMSLPGEQGEKVTSGFVVHVKCSEIESFDVACAVAMVPVFAFKAEGGVDLHFSTKIEHQELLEKVAIALAGLEFEPNIFVTKPVDTAAGVK